MKYQSPIFDRIQQAKSFGFDIKLRGHLDCLKPVERYFVESCNKRGAIWAYDISSEEQPYFRTLNYTTYAGMFIVNPLQTEVSLRQMYDALRDSQSETVDFYSFLKQKSDPNKYQQNSHTPHPGASALVVLPGSNLTKTHVCLNKIRWIIENHQNDVVFKPHPITHDETIRQFIDVLKINPSQVADKQSDLYALLRKSEKVYTTHVSESAAYAAISGKNPSPVDPVQSRIVSGFAHINYFFFFEPSPETWVNQMFSSPMSGIFHPDIDKDWRKKIDDYLDYILNVKSLYKDAFIYGSKT